MNAHTDQNQFIVRRFERGFKTDFHSLQSWCEKHGYVFARDRACYVVKPKGSKGRAKRMTWAMAMHAIDEIRVRLGFEPMMNGRV